MMWFTAETGNLLGVLLGTGVGVLGGVWGALAGLNAPKGKWRGLVLHFGEALLGLGIVCLAVAAAALILRQPWHVWYVFLLVGAVLAVGILPGYFGVRQVYTKAELRKMTTDDLG